MKQCHRFKNVFKATLGDRPPPPLDASPQLCNRPWCCNIYSRVLKQHILNHYGMKAPQHVAIQSSTAGLDQPELLAAP